ncbi:MAG: hypothetical protein ABWZ57_07175 [Mesorhizobium sp.]
MSPLKVCALPDCESPVSRSNQAYCCKAHKQLGYRARNRNTEGGEVAQDQETVTRPSAPEPPTLASKQTAFRTALSASARPCTRKGYPPGLFEVRDQDDLPIFFDADGRRLHRVHGPNALSEIELSMQKLILADDLPVDAEALRPAAPFRFYHGADG